MDRKKVRTFLIIVMLAVALLLGQRLPAALAAATSNNQVFSGTVVTAAGGPAANATVALYVAPGNTGTSTLIGTATTGANGTWSLPAPPYAALPKAAQVAAAANMGYLNVEVVATDGSSMSTAVESAWVGLPALATETSSNRPLPMLMRLASPTADKSTKVGCCSPRFGCSFPFVDKVLARTHAYTVVGEYHAYWDASGGLSYSRGATSSIGSYLSGSGTGWSFQGYDSYSSSNSLTMGFPSNGPFDSHQMLVSLKYVKQLWEITDIASGAVCSSWQQIDEDGIYNPGNGWIIFKQGASVIKDDGNARYQAEKRNHPSYINRIARNAALTLDTGKAVTYGVAADAFGVGIQAETTHSTDIAQDYAAGSSRTRYHWVWGNDANITGSPNVVYSY